MYLALLQLRSTPFGPGLPSMETLPFNRPVRGLLPNFSMQTILFDGDDSHYATLIKRRSSAAVEKDSHENIPLLSTESAVAVQSADGGPQVHNTIV